MRRETNENITGKRRGRPPKNKEMIGQQSIIPPVEQSTASTNSIDDIEAEILRLQKLKEEMINKKVEIKESTLTRSKNIISGLVNILSNSNTTKSDIIDYLYDKTSDEELSVVFGTITNKMVKTVKDNDVIMEPVVVYREPENVEFFSDSGAQISMSEDDRVKFVGANGFEVLDIVKMDKAVKKSIVEIPSREEARFLEDIFYQTQAKRIAVENQIRSLRQGADNDIEASESNRNKLFLEWYLYNMQLMETQVKKALEAFSDSNYLSRWAKANIGIGPIFATRLVANLDIKEDEFGNCTTHPNNWWSYCGLNDNNRPWLSTEQAKAMFKEALEENHGVLDDECVYILCSKTQWKFEFYESKCKHNGVWSKDDLIKYTTMIPYNRRLKSLM